MIRKVISGIKSKFGYKYASTFFNRLKNTKGIITAAYEKVPGLGITVAMGDMCSVSCADAVLVPHFESATSRGGIGGKLLSSVFTDKSDKGLMEKTFKTIDEQIAGNNGFGTAFITSIDGQLKQAGWKALGGVCTAAAPKEDAAEIVTEAVYNFLMKADKAGLKSVAMPALNTGRSGTLTPKTSSDAMYAGINKFLAECSNKPKNLTDVAIVVFQDSKEDKEQGGIRKLLAAPTDDSPVCYGTGGYSVFMAEAGKAFKKIEVHNELDSEYVAARRVIADVVQRITGEEVSKTTYNFIAEKLVSMVRNPKLALSMDVMQLVLNELKEISGSVRKADLAKYEAYHDKLEEFFNDMDAENIVFKPNVTIDDIRNKLGKDAPKELLSKLAQGLLARPKPVEEAELQKYIKASCTLHMREIEKKIKEADAPIQKQLKTIEGLREMGIEVDDDPKFADVLEKIKKIESFKQDCTVLMSSMQKILKSGQAGDIDRLKTENTALEKRLAALEKELGSAQKDATAYERKMAKLEQENTDLEKEIAKMKKQASSSSYSPVYSAPSRSYSH